MKKLLFLAGFTILLLTSCDPESLTTQSTNAIAGSYVVTSLQSNVAVDLDGNGTSSTDMLSEATCVQQMTVDFNANGTFSAVVADVSFDVNNILVCTTSVETGTYTYANGILTVTAMFNGGSVTESQAVVLNPTNFSFTLDSNRINQAFPDLSTTRAAGISNLDIVYTRI